MYGFKIKLKRVPKRPIFLQMSITLRIHDGAIVLPPELKIPDGTEVEIIIPAVVPHPVPQPGTINLPVFNGGGFRNFFEDRFLQL
jgi:hypothetical protein